MNMHLKEIGDQVVHPRRWSGFAWSMVLFAVLCAAGTTYLGVKLYQVTERPVGFNTH
jgi:hypothetical protein